ncbi:hypothetical protein [Embleya sp. NPDC050493]|uniref:hypothetical protein n=1 Tax=Embleya sp. NPDC050493 TaxID=3363989 RepID=UPI00379BB3A0
MARPRGRGRRPFEADVHCYRCRYEWGAEATWRPRDVMPMLPPTPAEDRAVAAQRGSRRGTAGGHRGWLPRRTDPYETPILLAEAPDPEPASATPAGPAGNSAAPDPDAVVAAHASRILDHLAGIALVDGDDPDVTLAVLRDVATAVETIVAGTTAHA